MKFSSTLLASAITLPSTTAHSDALTQSAPTGARRLLQRFENRRALHSASVDAGILSTPRLLQDYEYYCPRETCPSELCDCADKGGSLEDCTAELQGVCAAGKLGDCVYEGYIAVYQAVYCPFVQCLGEGFLQDQCDCAFYDLYCSKLNGEECKSNSVIAESDTASDKKPFFGCDESELATVCDQAKTCKDGGTLEGLPMGTWVGTSMAQSAGSAAWGTAGGVIGGVTLLSALFGCMNA